MCFIRIYSFTKHYESFKRCEIRHEREKLISQPKITFEKNFEKLKINEIATSSSEGSDDATSKSNSLNQLLQYYEDKFSKSLKNEADLMEKINFLSQRNVNSQMENNLLLNQLIELRDINSNVVQKLKQENDQFKQKVSEYEKQIDLLRHDMSKLKESLDAKSQDLERMEKDCEEITEKLQKQLEIEKQSKKELQAKAGEYKVKLIECERAKSSCETKLKETEEKLCDKEKELTTKVEQLTKAESEVEKLKAVFAYVKNVAI